MNEKQFIKTATRVRGILERDEFAREDDFYLTWKFWTDIDPDLESLTMGQFKVLFISGYFGLPASITRARALVQNKTNPELASKFFRDDRTNRAEILRRFFCGDPSRIQDPDLGKVYNNLMGEEILERLKDVREGYRMIQEDSINEIDITTKEMKSKIKTFGAEKYHSVGEYIALYERGLNLDFNQAKEIREACLILDKKQGHETKFRNGSGIREGTRIQVFRYSVLKAVIDAYKSQKSTI